jgi:uncharacterized membrane protein
MSSRLVNLLTFVLIVLSIGISLYFYPQLPPTLVTHWGINGEPNGYSPKIWALFFLPVLMFALSLLFRFLPSVDPYRKNYSEFKSYYQSFVLIVFVFLFYLYLLTIIWNLGYHFDLIRPIAPAMAVLFYYAGILTAAAKRNWFVGIRTPWTLSSDRVWNKTHLIGSKLFKASALISLLAIAYPALAVYFLIGPMIISVIAVFIYSYYLYQQKN